VISRVATALKTKPAAAVSSSLSSASSAASKSLAAPAMQSSASAPSLQGVPPLSASAASTTVFGKRLSDLSSEGDDAKKSSPRSKNYLPVVVRAAIAEIDRHLALEPPVFALTGLFREAVSHGKLRSMRARIDAGENVDLRDEESPHFAANLLKLWLRELPTPLLPLPVQERLLAVLAADDETDDTTAEAVRVALAKMNAGRRTAVLEIVGLLHRCAQKHEKTRMNARQHRGGVWPGAAAAAAAGADNRGADAHGARQPRHDAPHRAAPAREQVAPANDAPAADARRRPSPPPPPPRRRSRRRATASRAAPHSARRRRAARPTTTHCCRPTTKTTTTTTTTTTTCSTPSTTAATPRAAATKAPSSCMSRVACRRR
jgi:hypothetical protein